jgi:hypothetical protein
MLYSSCPTLTQSHVAPSSSGLRDNRNATRISVHLFKDSKFVSGIVRDGAGLPFLPSFLILPRSPSASSRAYGPSVARPDAHPARSLVVTAFQGEGPLGQTRKRILRRRKKLQTLPRGRAPHCTSGSSIEQTACRPSTRDGIARELQRTHATRARPANGYLRKKPTLWLQSGRQSAAHEAWVSTIT